MADLTITENFTDGTALTQAQLAESFASVSTFINGRNQATSSWDKLSVTGVVTMASTLAVTGAITLTGAVTTGSTLSVAGTSTLTGAVTMTAGMAAALAMGTHKITGLSNGTVASDAAAYGQIKILQVTMATSTTAFTTTSATYQSTNLTGSITPTSASNKVLVFATGVISIGTNSDSAFATIFRGVTDLDSTTNGFATIRSVAGGAIRSPATLIYLDSPASTSSTTYTIKLKNNDGAATAGFGTVGGTQVLILCEVNGI